MKTIAVLLTVHNRKEKTMKCLENLFNQQIPSGYSIAIYLTDDGCTDGTVEAVKKRFPTVQIVQGDGTLYWNRGMWTAWNAAAKHNHDYYLWLNDDTYLLPGAIEELVQSATRCHEDAIVVGACRDEKHHVLRMEEEPSHLRYPTLLVNCKRYAPSMAISC